MFVFTPVSPHDIFAVGVIPFLLSFVATMAKIFLQAIRFYYFIRKFIGKDISSFWRICLARLAGEFVTQTTPSYVGGELVRIAFLAKNNVPAGKAAWVTTFIGILLILIALPTFGFWFFILIYSSKKNIRLPSFSLKIAKKFISEEKASKGIISVNKALDDLCEMSRDNFGSFKSVKIF